MAQRLLGCFITEDSSGESMPSKKVVAIVLIVVAAMAFVLGTVLTERRAADDIRKISSLSVLIAVLGQSKQIFLLSEVSRGLDQRSHEDTRKYLCTSMKVSVDAMNLAKKQFLESSMGLYDSKEQLRNLETFLSDIKDAENAMRSAGCS
jgi:hypothetical protein